MDEADVDTSPLPREEDEEVFEGSWREEGEAGAGESLGLSSLLRVSSLGFIALWDRHSSYYI